MSRLATIPLSVGKLTRIGYVDVAVPPEVVGLSAGALKQVAWREPLWVEGGQVRVGAAAWIVEMDNQRWLFDPFLAADAVLRADKSAEAHHQSAIAQVLADAGFARESIDRVVVSHIEGVGMVAWRNAAGSWSPFFPNAKIMLSEVALSEFLAARPNQAADIEREAWQALVTQNCIQTFADGERLNPCLTAAVAGGHCPGHSLFHLGEASQTAEATLLGHLAVSPLHLVTGECPELHTDPKGAWALLQKTVADGRKLVGPLWPAPGWGRWQMGALITEVIGEQRAEQGKR